LFTIFSGLRVIAASAKGEEMRRSLEIKGLKAVGSLKSNLKKFRLIKIPIVRKIHK
jgi:hypothetical protein